MTHLTTYEAIEAEARSAAAASLPGLKRAVEISAGERYPNYEPGCLVCQSWAAFDYLCHAFDFDPDEIESRISTTTTED
jgi:hypothetical protein